MKALARIVGLILALGGLAFLGIGAAVTWHEGWNPGFLLFLAIGLGLVLGGRFFGDSIRMPPTLPQPSLDPAIL